MFAHSSIQEVEMTRTRYKEAMIKHSEWLVSLFSVISATFIQKSKNVLCLS